MSEDTANDTEQRREASLPTVAGYQPLRVTIPMETLNDAIDALEVGWEYAKEALAQHECSLGRTTRSNRMHAEIVEDDIDKLFRARGILNIYSNNNQ